MRSAAALSLLLTTAVLAQKSQPPQTVPNPPRENNAAVARYIRYSDAMPVALMKVRLIDGTGAPALEGQTILIDRGKISAIGTGIAVPANAAIIEGEGLTVFPGLVGMHDHMYYIARPNLDAEGRSEPPLVVPQMTFTSPHLYLGAGVTTLRTTGSVEPYTDLNLKREIDAGHIPGPHMDVTAPYLEGPHSPFIQMHQLKDEADARATVDFWAAQGATSFKAYMNITRAELGAAIAEAHKLGIKVTGHLCSVTYPEAIALGIDDLEHGFFVNTQLDPGKQPDTCPATTGAPPLAAMSLKALTPTT
jgi:imidazolonepropionase-like amidohydrolase